MDNVDDFEVGYGKPPKSNQFKKGVSGNPKGRPKGSVNAMTSFRQVFLKKIVMTENGKKKVITQGQGIQMRLVNKALADDMPAIKEALKWLAFLEADDNVPGGEGEDHTVPSEMLAGFLKRHKQAREEDMTGTVKATPHDGRLLNVIE